MAAMTMAPATNVARRNMAPTSLLDGAARLKGTSDVPCSFWPMATHMGELTGRRLVITFVPTTPLDDSATAPLTAWASAQRWPSARRSPGVLVRWAHNLDVL